MSKALDELLSAREAITNKVKTDAAEALIKLSQEANFWWEMNNRANANAQLCEDLMVETIKASTDKDGTFYPDRTISHLNEKYKKPTSTPSRPN